MIKHREPIALLHAPDFQTKLAQCSHCGLCLSTCPTYALNGREAQSPRGRIALMRAAADGRVALANDALAEHLDSCLACRACESVCPSGVQYGALIEELRIAQAEARTPGRGARLARWLGLRQLMPHNERLKLLAAGTWLYQRSGLQRALRASGLLPAVLKRMEALAPPVSRSTLRPGMTVAAQGMRRGRVAFLHGCVQETFLGQVNAATLRVLQRNGYEVVVPRGQGCCGAAQLHSGDEQHARALARSNIDALLAVQADYIISNAGGCGLTLKEYPHLLRDDPDYRTRVALFASQVRDISEFLVEQRITPPTGRVPRTATYVDSCHLRHGQHVVNQPRTLLRAIPGLRLVELQQPERCCGSAGTYNLTHPAQADALLAQKIADIRASGADLVVVANTGCHIQVAAGVRAAGLAAEVKHIVEVLERSYAQAE